MNKKNKSFEVHRFVPTCAWYWFLIYFRSSLRSYYSRLYIIKVFKVCICIGGELIGSLGCEIKRLSGLRTEIGVKWVKMENVKWTCIWKRNNRVFSLKSYLRTEIEKMYNV